MKAIRALRSPFFSCLLAAALWSCHRKQEAGRHAPRLDTSSFLMQRADSLYTAGHGVEAYAAYTSLRREREAAKDTSHAIYALLMMADIQKQYNDYQEMQALTIEALRMMNQRTDPRNYLTAYNNLGISYCQLDDTPKAIANYEKCLTYSPDILGRRIVWNNIGYAYMTSGDYKAALRALAHAGIKTPARDLTDALILDNAGFTFYKLSRPGGVRMLREALALRTKLGDRFGAVTSCIHLAEALAETDISQALAYARTGNSLAESTRSADDRLLAMSFLVRHAKTGEASRVAKAFLSLSDSLQDARRKARNAFADIRYNFRAEHENRLRSEALQDKAQLEAARQQNAKLTWAGVAVMLSILMAAAIQYWRKRDRRSRAEASLLAEARISRQLHDELANDMHRAMVFAENNPLEAEGKERLLSEMEDLYRRVRDVSRENAARDPGTNFPGALRNLFQDFNGGRCRIFVQDLEAVRWQRFPDYRKNAIFRIIQELLVNMRKHSGATAAIFRFSATPRHLTLQYSDNGKGQQVAGSGFMENRISDLKGTVTFDAAAAGGLAITIEIPFT